MNRGNIDNNLPDARAGEVIQLLAEMNGGQVRIERILSEGQATPPGEWYDQMWDEWVVLLRGGAELEFADPPDKTSLAAGDWLLIPAHRRHRVRHTEKGTFWLAVHAGGYGGPPDPRFPCIGSNAKQPEKRPEKKGERI